MIERLFYGKYECCNYPFDEMDFFAEIYENKCTFLLQGYGFTSMVSGVLKIENGKIIIEFEDVKATVKF